MLRELSSVFIAIWSVVFLLQLGKLGRGRAEYDSFVAQQRRPGWVAFHLVAFLFSLLHAVTWFQLSGVVLSGMAQKVRVGGERSRAHDYGWQLRELGRRVARHPGGTAAGRPEMSKLWRAA